jgi:DNA-binding SARP family transcriptional activator
MLLAKDDAGQAIDLEGRALTCDPWSEPAHRLIVAGCLAQGDRSGARKALDRCRAMLEELDVEPEPKTLVLERRLTGELSRTS